MEFKTDQKLASAYLALGAACGLLSNSLTNIMLPYALILPLVIYAATTFALLRFARGQKRMPMITTSFLTFVLVWAVVWVVLFNI